MGRKKKFIEFVTMPSLTERVADLISSQEACLEGQGLRFNKGTLGRNGPELFFFWSTIHEAGVLGRCMTYEDVGYGTMRRNLAMRLIWRELRAYKALSDKLGSLSSDSQA